MVRGLSAQLPRLCGRFDIVDLFRGPIEGAVCILHQVGALGRGLGRRVRQIDDGRFQALGAVGGHDPHLALAILLLALHVDL